MDLHPIEPGLFGQLRRARKAANDLGDLGRGHLARLRKQLGIRPQIQGHGRGRPRFLPHPLEHLPPGVVDLHPELATTRPPHLSPTLEGRQILSVFQHHPTRPGQGPAVDHHIASEDQTRAALGPPFVQGPQGLVRKLLAVGHVFFH